MRKIVVSEGLALDGVFEAETMGQWSAPFYSEERDEFVRENVLAADALLLGRTTYDLQSWYWPNQKKDKYGIADHKNSMAKYVVTSRSVQSQWNNSTIINRNAIEEISELKQQAGKNILIEGSATLVDSLAKAGLIDEYRLMLHPVIAGRGKRFFKEGMGLTKLKLVQSRPISLGVLLLTYEPANN